MAHFLHFFSDYAIVQHYAVLQMPIETMKKKEKKEEKKWLEFVPILK